MAEVMSRRFVYGTTYHDRLRDLGCDRRIRESQRGDVDAGNGC